MENEQLTLPPGSRLLHIGPHKTGTSALQGAFHKARERLGEYGVKYAGTGRQPAHAASAIAGGTPVNSLEPPNLAHWKALCEEVANADAQRVVISSERFSNADDDTAGTVVEGLGGSSRVHVVVTLRPLLKILPSQWQEYVKTGARYSYEKWLTGMLHTPPYDKPTPSFWRRHRHDALVKRWADAVGKENVTVVIVDQADPLFQLRVFEKLVGLPEQILVPEEGVVNRSLTFGEVELLRRFNTELGKREWIDPRYRKVAREQVIREIRKAHEPSRNEAKIVTPAWAESAATEISKEMVANLSSLGVRIVGDLSVLTPQPNDTAVPVGEPTVPAPAAAGAALGAVLAGRVVREALPTPTDVESMPVSAVPARELLRIARQRALRKYSRKG